MTALSDALAGVAWQGGALVVSDPAKIQKIRRKNLSVSVAHKVAQCPAAMAAETLLPRPSDPFGPRELGSADHKVLEHMYDLAAELRTPDFVTAEVQRMADVEWAPDKLESRDSQSLQANSELKAKWIERITHDALGIFEMEKPAEITVYKTEWKISGIKIGVNAIPFLGYIDRTDIIDDDGKLAIRDYKFGKWKLPNPRFGDDYGDQMRLYTVAAEAELDVAPVEAKLIYPIAGKERKADLSPGAVAQSLLAFDLSWQTMNRSADAEKFTAQPSNLCAWCPLVNSCPVAKVISQKAIDHAKTQPSAADLGIPTILSQPSASPRIDNPEQPRKEQPIMSATEAAAPAAAPINLAAQYPVSEYAAIAVFSLADTATTHLDSQGMTLSSASIAAFSNVLADILVGTVKSLFGNSGWEHGKLARVEYSLKTALELRPAPFGKDAAAWAQWQKGIKGLVSAKATAALALLESTDTDPTAYSYFVVAAAAVA